MTYVMLKTVASTADQNPVVLVEGEIELIIIMCLQAFCHHPGAQNVFYLSPSLRFRSMRGDLLLTDGLMAIGSLINLADMTVPVAYTFFLPLYRMINHSSEVSTIPWPGIAALFLAGHSQFIHLDPAGAHGDVWRCL
jgi:hypothetical protein